MTLEGKTILDILIEDTATQDTKHLHQTIDGAGLGWPVVLQAFVDFIGDFYGYDISQEVAIRRNPVRLRGGWKGQYFGVATDEEIEMAARMQDAEDGQMNLDFGPEGDD